MEVYKEVVKYPVFMINQVIDLTGNSKAAYSKLEGLMRKGLVKKIRKNIYSAVNLETDEIVGTRYHIACAISDSAYISHHSAFEYYNLTKEKLSEVYVSSDSKFNHFEYDHVTYKFIASRMKEGIVEDSNSGILVTDLERTVIDSIHDYNKTGGFKELLNCLGGIYSLDEVKLLKYLEIYNNQGLYQITGYILQHYQENMGLSDAFIVSCKNKIGKSRRYLLKEIIEGNTYNREWELMIPKGIFEINKIMC